MQGKIEVLDPVRVACLSTAPGRCQTIYLREDEPGNMVQCLFSGAKQPAKWTEEHPGYVVKHWSCGQPRA